MSHELCHLFGLAHCHYFQCAMNESSSIAEAATQPLFLCPICLRKLDHFCHLDISSRFSGLLEVSVGIDYSISGGGRDFYCSGKKKTPVVASGLLLVFMQLLALKIVESPGILVRHLPDLSGLLLHQ